jgi:NAD(P)-dependent dehydrogenase (short-subunit alcohol dehydrogenase family)
VSLRSLDGATVLVTGGTRGLGKAIGFEFARAGARVTLTHRWGSVSAEEIAAEAAALRLPPVEVRESDAGDPDAVRELMRELKRDRDRLDVIISNLAFAKPVHDMADLKRSSFELSLRYSAWPVVDLVQAAQETFGRYPRYVVGVSSLGADVCPDGYDLAGASKSALEMLCRYLALRLRTHGTTVNVLRTGYLDTTSSRATFGDAVIDELGRRGMVLDPSGAAKSCVALCSGLMDSVTGQILVADEGWSLVDPIAYVSHSMQPKKGETK